jgi:MFS family permease
MTLLALPWLVLETTESPTQMSLVVAADVAPVVLLSVPLGAVAGRFGIRATLLIGDVARAVLIVAIALLSTAGQLPFPLLLILVFLHGMLWAPYYAAQGALVPHLLGDDERDLTRGIALFQTSTRLTYFVGPALGGLLIAAIGPIGVLWIDAATYLVAFALLARYLPAESKDVRRPAAGRVWAGLKLLLVADRFLRGWTAAGALAQMAFQALVIALPILAFVRYGQDPAVAGLLVGGWGAGALLGSLAALRVPQHAPPLVTGTIAWLVQALVLWLLVVPMPVSAAVAILVVSGLANGLRVPPLRAFVVRRIPDELRVQTLAAETSIPYAAGLLVVLLAGPTAETFGVTTLLAACALIATAGALGFTYIARRHATSTAAKYSNAGGSR